MARQAARPPWCGHLGAAPRSPATTAPWPGPAAGASPLCPGGVGGRRQPLPAGRRRSWLPLGVLPPQMLPEPARTEGCGWDPCPPVLAGIGRRWEQAAALPYKGWKWVIVSAWLSPP